MKNKILLLIVVVLSIIAVSSSKKESAFFNNETKENTNTAPTNQENIKLAIKDSTTGNITNIDLEEYIIGVVAGEMPASFEKEALKAQAIASRTYAIYKMKNNIKDYDLVTDITNQIYITKDKMKDAVNETKGLIMTYEGNVIISMYFAKSNGKTEDSQYVFGSNKKYLKSVDSPEENIVNSITINKSEFCNKLNIVCDNIIIKDISKSQSGRINSITINDRVFKGTEVRTLLNLKSTDFEIKVNDSIEITTKGYGHGVGMSQYGANELAKNGYKYDEILKHYYQNVNVEQISV